MQYANACKYDTLLLHTTSRLKHGIELFMKNMEIRTCKSGGYTRASTLAISTQSIRAHHRGLDSHI